ncbi:hypothetical protein [Clostridium tyrobutyricum]|uniref:hypothetical protein n=1 Tax=Clostridium tyrobutyricum TaxID=1519 RepID=UPI00351CEEB1
MFFRQTKNNLGINKYQVRSSKAIDRILLLASLTYTYCLIEKDANDSFGKGIILRRNQVNINVYCKYLYLIFLIYR